MQGEYRMDDATFGHLTAWCDRQYVEESATAMRNRMVDMLESMLVEDAEYALSHGWGHVAGLLEKTG